MDLSRSPLQSVRTGTVNGRQVGLQLFFTCSVRCTTVKRPDSLDLKEREGKKMKDFGDSPTRPGFVGSSLKLGKAGIISEAVRASTRGLRV